MHGMAIAGVVVPCTHSNEAMWMPVYSDCDLRSSRQAFRTAGPHGSLSGAWHQLLMMCGPAIGTSASGRLMLSAVATDYLSDPAVFA